MIQPEFKELVFKFAKEAARDEVASIFLFGSVAKGIADNRSDVDLLVVFDTNREDFESLKVKNMVSELVLDLEKEHDRAIQLVTTNRAFHGLDEHFVKNVLEEGILLYASPPEINIDEIGLGPYVLFVLDFRGINQKDKSRIKRKLFGHKTKKTVNGREYQSLQKGKVEELLGYRTGTTIAFLPQKQARNFEKFLEEHRVKFNRISLWLTNDDVIKFQHIKA